MPRLNIGQVLVLVTCIYTSTIPITVALLSNINAAKLNDDTTSTTVEGVISKLIDENSSETTCPNYCTCNSTKSGSSIIARCTELIDETYAKSNIEHFILRKSDNLILGPDELHVRSLNHLKSIALTNHLNTTFDRTAPMGLPFRTTATPNYHGMLDIHPDIFQNNSELERLTIYHFEHFMDGCNMRKNYLFDARSLTKLILSISDYKCWSSSSFSKMPNLTHLCIQSPNFKIIPGIFGPLHNLVELELRHISHLNIAKDTFDGINPENLILAYSAEVLLANIQVPGLKYLNIERNSIKNIGKDDFIGLPTLEELVIIDAIDTIHEDAFTHLPRLKYLEIHHSNIVLITENHLRNNVGLELLTLTNANGLKNLPVFKLSNTVNNNYSIYEFDCWDCDLVSIREGTFNAMPALRRLNLYKNHLQTLPRGLFKPLSLLESLDLSANFISNIPDEMFEGAIKLVHLNLAENPLTTLKMTPFLQTPELSILDLGRCRIKVWSGATSPINSLKFLSLYHNELKHITVEQLQSTPNLQELKALDNPIQCDDQLQNIVEWSISHHLVTQFFVSSTTNCKPDNVKKSCWEDFQKVLCAPNYISELELMKQVTRRDYSPYTSTYNDELSPYNVGDITTDNISLSYVSELESDNLSSAYINYITTINTSLGYVSELQTTNTSATPIIHFILIIITISATTLIT